MAVHEKPTEYRPAETSRAIIQGLCSDRAKYMETSISCERITVHFLITTTASQGSNDPT